MKAVILAGGLGTRLSEETDSIPKPMVTVGDKPILWHIMKMYSHHGINDFVICLGYKGYAIKEYFSNYHMHTSDVVFDIRTGEMQVLQNSSEPWRVTLVDTGMHSQTGGRLRRVRNHLHGEPFCFTYGDGVGDVDITASIEFHRKHGKLATVTVVTPPGRFGAIELSGNQVTKFLEKPITEKSSINGGFFVLDPAAIDYIDSDETIWERAPLETLARDGELMAFQHGGFWSPMDTLRDRRYLQDLWAAGKAPWHVWK